MKSQFASTTPVSLVHKRRDWLPYVMNMPAILVMIGILYPFAIAVYYSLTNYSLIRNTYQFIGLHNYYAGMLTNAEFWKVLGNTLVFAGACMMVELVLGTLIALLLNRPVKGIVAMRIMMMIPMMIPPVISGMMWKTMLASSSGPVNYLFGLGTFSWFSNVGSARLAIILIVVWSGVSFTALVLYSGLQSMPKEPFEAAQVDGASYWFVIRHLVLPMLRQFVLVVLFFRAVDLMKLFDIIFAATRGGPMQVTTTIPIMAYKEVFISYNMGSAIAKVLILWVINFVICFRLSKYWRKSTSVIGEVE